jgi:hypothetical protein
MSIMPSRRESRERERARDERAVQRQIYRQLHTTRVARGWIGVFALPFFRFCCCLFVDVGDYRCS